jgi:hypothetical protein
VLPELIRSSQDYEQEVSEGGLGREGVGANHYPPFLDTTDFHGRLVTRVQPLTLLG